MTLRKTAFAALPATLLAAGTAFAAEVEDMDGDGMFSFEEVLATYSTLTEEVFTAIDTDADGKLSPDELAVAEEAGVLVAES